MTVQARRNPLFFAIAAFVTMAKPIAAQRLDREIVPAAAVIHLRQDAAGGNVLASMFSSSTPDHRWEGLAIGALVLGVGGAIAGSQLCHLSDSANQHCARTTIGLGLLGVVAGGITGGLIGGSIPKAPPD